MREEKLATMLRGKDEEVEKLVAQRTQELEQRHKEALDAQALVHAGKVKELEVAHDELKKQALKLTGESDAAKGALADTQAAVLGKAELLSTANNSIRDMKLKLEGLEGMLSEAKAREETLAKDLEAEKQLRKNEAANHKDFLEGENRWISRLVDVAGRITT